MSSFQMIEKLGLTVWDNRTPHCFVVDAEELEALLQSAQVVYEVENSAGINSWLHIEAIGAKSKALLIGIAPIKKKTKAEAALEFLNQQQKCLEISGLTDNPDYRQIKKILEMKDEV